MLLKERNKLRDTDAYTILDYIKTSIEILMNMKMEENDSGDNSKGGKVAMRKGNRPSATNNISDTDSVRSMEEPPKDYEAMLQKYEAEVRNHIKIEQQLKLHIECVQDKLDDSEKTRDKLEKEKTKLEDDFKKDQQRLKDLLSLREKEIEQLQTDFKKLLKTNEDLKISLYSREAPIRSITAMGTSNPTKSINEKSASSAAVLEELSYNQNFES